MADLTVKQTGNGAPQTVSRRADGQPEGPNPGKAPAPVSNGASRSELAAEEGVSTNQAAELTQRSVAGVSVEGAHTGH